MAADAMLIPDTTRMAVNYGLDRVRFLAPVKAGKRVRGHFTLDGAEEKAPGQLLLRHTGHGRDRGRGQARPHRPVARPHLHLGEYPMSVRDAVIVSTARTPIGRAYKGAFNATAGATLGALSLAPAIERAGIEAGEIDDVVWGCVLTQGTQAGNIGRQVALRAGCPVTVGAQTIDRQCASGLMAIATAAKQVIVDRMDIVAAGGQDSISLVQTPEMRISGDPSLIAMHKDVYMPMLRDRRDGRPALRHRPRGAGRIFAAVATAHRRRPGRGPASRRDRARNHQHGHQGQGDRRGLVQGSHASTRTRATAPTRRSKASPRFSRCWAPAPTSPPATPASLATARPPAS